MHTNRTRVFIPFYHIEALCYGAREPYISNFRDWLVKLSSQTKMLILPVGKDQDQMEKILKAQEILKEEGKRRGLIVTT